MSTLKKTFFATRAGSRLAVHESEGAGPCVFGIGGLSIRPISISGVYNAFDHLAENGRRCVLMEIAGGGESPAAPNLTMDTWLADVEQVFGERVREPAIWTGSSMGGWLMALAHRRHPEWFRAMCAIAPAFDWDQQYIVPAVRDGKLRVAGDVVVNPEGNVLASRELLMSMAPHHVLQAPFQLHAPLHVIFGGRDEVAPPEATKRFIQQSQGARCTGQFVAEADHAIAKLEWDYAPAWYVDWVGSSAKIP